MNEDLNAKIDQLIEALTAVMQKIDEQQSRIDELDSVVFDGLVGPANEALQQQEYNQALSDFRTKYAEKLGPYEQTINAVEGDGFDIYKKAFDDYNEGGYDFSPDEYVDKLAASVAEQIEAIKEAVAEKEDVKPEDVEVNVDAKDGEVQVDVDNKKTEEKPEDNAKEEEKEEDGETLEDFEESLRKEAEKDSSSWIRG